MVTDLGWNIDREELSHQIMEEIYTNVPQYIHFHRITMGKDNTIRSFIQDCEKFLFKKGYMVDATDVVIAASADALNINLYIYQEIRGKAVIVQQRCGKEQTEEGVFLKFSHKPSATGIEDHYDAIVDVSSKCSTENKEEQNCEIGHDNCSVINVQNRNFPTPEHIEAAGTDAIAVNHIKQLDITLDDFPVEVGAITTVSET